MSCFLSFRRCKQVADTPVGMLLRVLCEECFCYYLPPEAGYLFMNTQFFYIIFSRGRVFHIFSEYVWDWGLSTADCLIVY